MKKEVFHEALKRHAYSKLAISVFYLHSARQTLEMKHSLYI